MEMEMEDEEVVVGVESRDLATGMVIYPIPARSSLALVRFPEVVLDELRLFLVDPAGKYVKILPFERLNDSEVR